MIPQFMSQGCLIIRQPCDLLIEVKARNSHYG
jgi:hypothetical protein